MHVWSLLRAIKTRALGIARPTPRFTAGPPLLFPPFPAQRNPLLSSEGVPASSRSRESGPPLGLNLALDLALMSDQPSPVREADPGQIARRAHTVS
jgi:hypothetical protein